MNKLIIAILVVVCTNSYSQKYEYTASAFGSTNGSFGLELGKQKDNLKLGVGGTTFFTKGARGRDYTGFFNPTAAYEVIPYYSGSLYGTVGIFSGEFVFSTRLGMGARTLYYNGKTNGVDWYVRGNGGTYLLYGVSSTYGKRRVRTTIGYDNVNGGLFGISVKFNEGK